MRYLSGCVGYHRLNPVTRECRDCYAKAETIFVVEGQRGAKN